MASELGIVGLDADDDGTLQGADVSFVGLALNRDIQALAATSLLDVNGNQRIFTVDNVAGTLQLVEITRADDERVTGLVGNSIVDDSGFANAISQIFALDADADRRRELFRAARTELQYRFFTDWAGVPGGELYDSLASGRWRYRDYILENSG